MNQCPSLPWQRRCRQRLGATSLHERGASPLGLCRAPHRCCDTPHHREPGETGWGCSEPGRAASTKPASMDADAQAAGCDGPPGGSARGAGRVGASPAAASPRGGCIGLGRCRRCCCAGRTIRSRAGSTGCGTIRIGSRGGRWRPARPCGRRWRGGRQPSARTTRPARPRPVDGDGRGGSAGARPAVGWSPAGMSECRHLARQRAGIGWSTAGRGFRPVRPRPLVGSPRRPLRRGPPASR